MKGYYHIITYGCQMNVHESEKIAGILQSIGYIYSSEPCNSKIVVFNTCCIRENAEFRAYGNIGALKTYKKDNPNVIIVVCGCMTQQDGVGEKLKKKFPFVDIILGTQNINRLQDAILAQECEKSFLYSIEQRVETDSVLPISRTSGVNAWVNIIYGCNNFCTYCIVPYVRGREKSRPHNDIVCEVKELLAQGYKEITLLGQNVNSYGSDTGKTDAFARLLEDLACLDYKFRLKFMTSHPKDLNDDVLYVIAKYPNISKCIHLPVQAGSDEILLLMNRKYSKDQYLELISKIQKKIPSCGITTDIMVGFPNETEDNFNETLDLVRRASFSAAFTFVYSRRSGTAADKMEGHIPEKIKSERIGRLIALQNEISSNNASKYVGNTYEVLIEGIGSKSGHLCGRTDCGRLVRIKSADVSLIGKFVLVKIIKSGLSTLTGQFS